MRTPELNFVAYIKADAGYFVLGTLGDQNGRPESVDKEPVIGWAITDDEHCHVPLPITADGLQTLNGNVLRPDGTVATSLDGRYPDLAAWLLAEQDDWEASREAARLDGGRKEVRTRFVYDQVAQPAAALSPARTAINAALAAAKAATGKGGA